jgi:hypothetical protein
MPGQQQQVAITTFDGRHHRLDADGSILHRRPIAVITALIFRCQSTDQFSP